jgi:hypothetical protein
VIDNCDAGDAGMDKCPGLIGGLNDPSTSCNIPSVVEERIDGVLAQLPGDNPLGQWGVGPGSGGATSSAAPASSSTAAHIVSTPSVASTVVHVISTPSSASTAGHIVSTPSAPSPPHTSAPIKSAASVSENGSATPTDSVVWVTSVNYITSIVVATVTVTDIAPAPTEAAKARRDHRRVRRSFQ